jgi:hypothetical protein
MLLALTTLLRIVAGLGMAFQLTTLITLQQLQWVFLLLHYPPILKVIKVPVSFGILRLSVNTVRVHVEVKLINYNLKLASSISKMKTTRIHLR